jgi:probable O-glycosylation ligase (exosortase A-associated)
MRDLLLCAFLLGGLPFAVARPFYGALIFTWLGLMNPHRFTWGYAYDMPWSMLYALAIMIGMALVGGAQILDSIRRFWPVGLLILWMGITTLFAVDSSAGNVFQDRLKIYVMCLLTLALLTTRQRIMWFSAVLIGSIAFFGVKGGIFTLLGGGENLVWGPPDSAITDNNHLAAGLVTILPLVTWAYTVARGKAVRLGLIGAQLLVAISILGSHSRGAFVAVSMMALFLIAKSRHKLAAVAVVVMVAAMAVSIMPERFWDRMDTIQTYEEDSSAMGRINTWWTAFNIANARPTGAGFNYYGSALYKAHAPNPDAVHSSHSIYFQALGEHGWIGLFLYLLFLLAFWRSCGALARLPLDREPDHGDHVQGKMLQVSLIGFMVAGAFVNIGNWDAIFYTFIIALALNRVREAEARAAKTKDSPSASPARSPAFRPARGHRAIRT